MTNGKKMLGLGVISFLAITIGSAALAGGSETTVITVAEEAPVVEQPPLPSDQHVIDVAIAELDAFFAETNRIESEKAQQARKSQRVDSAPAVEPNYDPGDGSRWDRLAQCEAGGNWATNTGNGFGGGLQFMHQRSYSTWLSFGGGEFAPHPWEASREQQIVVAERVLASSGWRAWPGCSRKFGWL
jgi:hypothetical protein